METGQFRMAAAIFILVFTLPASLITTVIAAMLTPDGQTRQWRKKFLVSFIGAIIGFFVFFVFFNLFAPFVGAAVSLVILWLIQRSKRES